MQLSPKQSKRAFYSLTSARLSSIIIQAGLLVWYTSVSSVQEVSVTLTWLSLALFLSGVTDLGFGTMITRFGFESRKTQTAILSLDTALTFALLMVVTLVSLIVIAFLPSDVSPEVVLIPFLLLSWCLLETIVEAGALVLVSQSRSALAGFMIIIRRLGGLALFPALLPFFSPGISFSFSLFLGTAVTYFFVPKAFDFKKQFQNLPPMRETLKFSVNSAWGLLRNLEGPLVASIFSPLISSSFLLAARLAAPIAVLTNSFGTVIVGAEKIARPRAIKTIVIVLLLVVGLSLSWVEWLSIMLLPVFSAVVPWADKQSLLITGLVLIRYVIAGVLAGVFSSMLIRFGEISGASKLNLFLNLSGLAAILIVGGILQDIYLALFASIVIGIIQVLFVGHQLRKKTMNLAEVS
jgi:hypothetical protein